MKHKGCVTDPLARAWWRDYLHIMEGGNPLGVSFTEYVALRVAAEGQVRYYVSDGSNAPSYMASCGHVHAWGASCSALAI